MQIEISDALISHAVARSYVVMEDREKYSLEDVTRAVLATIPDVVTSYLLYPEDIVRDRHEAFMKALTE